jgi:dienelactone hydrolase
MKTLFIRGIAAVLVFGCISVANAQDDEVLNVFDRWLEWSHGETMFMRHLNTQSFRLLDQREVMTAQLRTRNDWQQYRAGIRETLADIMGPMPKKTPLNVQVAGTLQKDGYRVEKIIFESLPNFFVTGAVFVPDGLTGKRPAIIYVPGHTMPCWRGEGYQNVCVNLAKKGFIVFGMDCIGQGERMQYLNAETGKSDIGGATKEHSYAANQCFLTGYSPVKWFVWDGIRAIDYLVSRPDVDPNRIGLTGRSGGGTQTAHIMAMDDRVAAAAPESYLTSYRRLLEAIGPQDGEQVLLHGLARGIDHADLMLARAPKPTLHVATTRDYFSIQGVRETAREMRRAYDAFDAPDAYRQVDDDLEHGITKKNNEAKYTFFQKYLNLPGSPKELNVPLTPEADLQVTATGQVSSALKSRTVFDVNREVAQPLIERLERARQKPELHLPVANMEARRLSGFEKPMHKEKEPVYRGRYQRNGYTVERWAIAGEGDMILPTLAFVPDATGPHPAVIYLHPEGKAADAAAGGRIEALVKAGYLVAAPDLPNTGETTHDFQSGHAPVQPFYNAQLGGRSVAGIHAGDVVRLLRTLQERADVQPDNIGVAAMRDMGPAAIHAAAFEPDITWLTLDGAPLSYADIVTSQIYNVSANAFVAGALKAYDLPDLLASVVPRKVALMQPANAMLEPASKSSVDQTYSVARQWYGEQNASDKLRIMQTGETDLLNAIRWCSR